ncbi:hypothetical protein CABS01_00789 [Colletotrichum abscissum]|uniref:DUF6546 domain-containing protein n=1 Tax=Colletotrichum abscissum TaxID=1671311 RepID=A0A9P9X488_9PEZI|nr:uncharacterized protein CABS01_00789 [Colletotrichum abscissum]KAI3535884.1 hypothetical protein CABS02_12765 [Colletotrichum abscissum]KAK1505321.1 hypothetical protein CABS01_00789 [Colletotrichum abscissum]
MTVPIQPVLMPGSKSHTTIPPHVATWGSLPWELRQMILQTIARQTSGWGACASVCKEWQAILEKESFRQLKLQASCLDDIEAMISVKQAKLVRHIWLNIELKPYTCRSCQTTESSSWACEDGRMARRAITKLFSILSQWPVVEGAELTLELSFQSPSDKEHCFKNLYFGGVGEDEDLKFDRPGHRLPHLDSKHSFHDSQHGWMNGRQVDAPNGNSFSRIFQPLHLTFKEGLPQVKAITRFVLRRQCRRWIEPRVLGFLFDKLPRLQSLIYEPWQSLDKMAQDLIWDSEYLRLIESHLPKALKKISVFEETNEEYITSFRPISPITAPDIIRITSPTVSAAFAKRSLSLEQLSVTFLIEASDFFQSRQKDWVWSHMRFLTLTSRILTQTENLRIENLLRNAATTALSIPHLHTMVLWNGRKGEAFKFFYHAKSSYTCIGWQGTWDWKLTPSVIRNWQRVADQNTRHDLKVIPEPLITTSIDSHAHAIELLDLPSEVVHPVSLLQMQREAESSWYKT